MAARRHRWRMTSQRWLDDRAARAVLPPSKEYWAPVDPCEGVLTAKPGGLQERNMARRAGTIVARWGMEGSAKAPPVGAVWQQGRPGWDDRDGGSRHPLAW